MAEYSDYRRLKNFISTRKVTLITEEICGIQFSKSTVSELCKNLDPVLESWNHRSLNDKRFPFVVVDAMVTKVREDGRVRSRGLLLAFGVNKDGYRELLAYMSVTVNLRPAGASFSPA